MKRIDISRVLFYIVSIVLFFGLSFLYGMNTCEKKTSLYQKIIAIRNYIQNSFALVSKEAPTLTKIRPTHFLQPARYKGTGVTINTVKDTKDALVFLTGFFENENQLRLIQRNGTIIAKWPAHYSEIFPHPGHLKQKIATDWNVDIHGAVALPDGSVVFNFENSGLVKLDRCGNIVWKLARNTHHSVEIAEGGGFWVPGKRYHPNSIASRFPPFQTPFLEDTIMKISEDGKVLLQVSVPQLFYTNGLESLLSSTGSPITVNSHDMEIVHLNKIAELSSDIADDFPLFNAGDLALSLRDYNLILVVDIHTKKIKWWRIGPWLRQHDPEFIPGGKLIVFNNNTFYLDFGYNSEQVCSPSLPRISNIIEVDPVTGDHRVVYGGRAGQKMLSIIRGKIEKTIHGGLLVTEFEGGRVFETNAEGRIIWEYINRYDSDEVAEITEARLYPADYFKIPDWTCK